MQLNQIVEFVGKKIAGIVVKRSELEPTSQVFVLFADRSYVEFYSTNSGEIKLSEIRNGDSADVSRYMAGSSTIVSIAV